MVNEADADYKKAFQEGFKKAIELLRGSEAQGKYLNAIRNRTWEGIPSCVEWSDWLEEKYQNEK